MSQPHSRTRHHLRALEEQAQARLDGVDAGRVEALFDALGDVALHAARRAPDAWSFDEDRLKGLLEHYGHDPLLLALAREHHFLVPSAEGLSFSSPEAMLWLAGRRIRTTEDEAGDLDLRLRGALMDAVAQAIATVEDPVESAQMLRLVTEEGPFEELLELGSLQGIMALGYNPGADDELRFQLIEKALQWTGNPPRQPHAAAAVCALITEQRGGPLAELVKGKLEERLEMEIDTMEALESLQLSLAALVGALDGEPKAKDFETLFHHFAEHPWMLAEAIRDTWRRGPDRDAVLRRLAKANNHALPLGLLDHHNSDDLDTIVKPLKKLAKNPTKEHLWVTPMALCDLAMTREDLPDQWALATLELLTVEELSPEVRAAMALALAPHLDLVEAEKVAAIKTLHEQLEESPDPASSLSLSTTLLLLGDDDPDYLAVLVAAVGAGFPSELLAQAVVRALARTPSLIEGLEPFIAHDERELALAALTLLDTFTPPLIEELTTGKSNPPIPYALREAALGLSLTAMSIGDDLSLAPAAKLAAWFGRGSEEVSETLLAQLNDSENLELRGELMEALGACGVNTPAIREALVGACISGDRFEVLGAAKGLKWLATEFVALEEVEADVPRLAQRAQAGGPEAEAIYDLLLHWVRLPAGYDPTGVLDRDLLLETEEWEA